MHVDKVKSTHNGTPINSKGIDSGKTEKMFDFGVQNNNEGLCIEHKDANWKEQFSLENIKKKYPEGIYKYREHDEKGRHTVVATSAEKQQSVTYQFLKRDNSIIIKEWDDKTGSSKITYINSSGEIEYIEDKQLNEDKTSVGLRYNYTDETTAELKYNSLGEVIHKVVKDKNGIILEENDSESGTHKIFHNGVLYKIHQKDSKNHISTHENLFANMLYDDIKGLGTGKEFAEHLNMIDKDIVVDVLKDYEKKMNESLISSILCEIGLSKEQRLEYVKIITGALSDVDDVYYKDIAQKINREAEYQLNKIGFVNTDYIELFLSKLNKRKPFDSKNLDMPNGKIDKDFKQGNIGDCWLISSIMALSLQPKGKKILEDSIQTHEDGSVTVTLKGVNKSYTFSAAEINGNNNLSHGDPDVRAIEMAIDNYFYKERGINTKLDIDGNDSHLAFQILTGKNGRTYTANLISSIKERYFGNTITEKQIRDFNKENHVVTVSNNRDEILKLDDETTLIPMHEYAVKRSDSKNVYILDPQESFSKEITVPKEKFIEFFNGINEMDL